MVKFVFLLALIFVGCQAEESLARHGNFNLYFLYTRDNPRVPIQILPTVDSVLSTDGLFRARTAIVVHGHRGTGSTSLNPVVKDGCQAEESLARHGNFNLYFLYTRDNPRVPIQILPTVDSVLATDGLFRARTAIVVHGHRGTGSTSLNPVVKDAFLSSEDVSVLVLDWATYAGQSYTNAVNAVPGVGVALAEFIEFLLAYNRVSLDRLHLVGFGLGAHVVGYAGRNLGGNVSRITGLDPSGSQWGSNSQRLRSSDARYVEVIHTDGSGLGANGIGTAIGHVDFFANGLGSQPGCLTHICNHNRSWELFAASLTHNQLTGRLCSSNTQMTMNLCRGYVLNLGNNELVKFGSGIFRANTGRRYPF